MKATMLYPESWLVDGEGAGNKAIKIPETGKFVSVQVGGEIEENRDSAGSWESGKKVGSELIVLAHGRAWGIPLALGV